MIYGVALVVIAAVAFAVRTRPARRVSVVVIVAVLLLLCVVPIGGFWTFAVSHGPTGDSCASCAIVDYLAYGPTGGYAADPLTFQRVLCDDHRSQLEAQADRIGADIQAATTGTQYGLLHADSNDEQTSAHNGATVVRSHVDFTFAGKDGYLTIDAHTWTFTLTDRDGWQVCGVTTPNLCGPILYCTHPSPTPAPQSSPSPANTEDPGLAGVYPTNLVPMDRCGPLDPFREWHSCPAQPPVTSSAE